MPECTALRFSESRLNLIVPHVFCCARGKIVLKFQECGVTPGGLSQRAFFMWHDRAAYELHLKLISIEIP